MLLKHHDLKCNVFPYSTSKDEMSAIEIFVILPLCVTDDLSQIGAFIKSIAHGKQKERNVLDRA